MGYRQGRRSAKSRQGVLLSRRGLSVSRESGDVAYGILCSRCDFFSFAVSGRGFMSYRDAVRLAERHVCDVLDFE